MFPVLSFLWHRFEICICCGKNFKHFFFSRLLPCHERKTLSPQHWRQVVSSRERGSKELRWAVETFLGVKINSKVFMWMEFVQLPISVSNQTSLHPRLRRRWKTDLNVSSCKLNNLISVSCILPWGGGGGRGTPFSIQYRRKGVQFQPSGIWKGRDFTCCSTSREICHSGGKKAQKGYQTDTFYGCEKVEKTFCCCDSFIF